MIVSGEDFEEGAAVFDGTGTLPAAERPVAHGGQPCEGRCKACGGSWRRRPWWRGVSPSFRGWGRLHRSPGALPRRILRCPTQGISIGCGYGGLDDGGERRAMSKMIEAVYENGVFRPLEPVMLPEGEHVRVSLPEVAAEIQRRLAALDAFDTTCDDLTERQWRL